MLRHPRLALTICRHSSFRQAVTTAPYDPHEIEVESRLYQDWIRRGLFNPNTQPSEPGAEPFIMCLPPPNVTGDLHIGHALAFTTEDALGRWCRMSGRPVLLIPGTDHAGIATQAVVERELAKRGTSRLALGREQFLQEVLTWSEAKQRNIRRQIERLGVSADWDRHFFTLDQARSNAVSEAFRRLHATGRIFRGSRIVNYCCALRSVISDMEVDFLSVEGPRDLALPGGRVPVGRLHRIAYPLEQRGPGGGPKEVVVATTRLETMLGDTALAVHPSDQRHSALIGRRVAHPLLAGRWLPIVADPEVDPLAGTGALKVTPGHSAADFAIAQRHGLEVANILREDGRLAASAGPAFQGLTRFEARAAVQSALQARGLYRGWEPHAQKLPLCSRTGDLVEPVLRPQWFVRCSGEMAERALEAVSSGALKIRPSNYAALWTEWMSKCQDWCISRQLWWGHRIPAFQSNRDGSWRVPSDLEETRELLSSSEWRQDEDVLDTWFSSALLPFSAVGWPNAASPDLSFFPTSALETGVDILFFWVARMVMLGQELTGQLPFREVLLHGLVCDGAGQKMSKSKGNVVDPLSLIEGCGKLQVPAIKSLGADALRAALLSFNTKTLHLNFSEQEVLKQRKFANKIWNTLRFVLTKLQPGDHLQEASLAALDPEDLPLLDRWLLQQLGQLVSCCGDAFEERQFHVLVKAVPTFWLDALSRTFLEVAKSRLAAEKGGGACERTQQVLFLAVDVCLRLLHPVMPFVTEFGWRALHEAAGSPDQKSLAAAAFPTAAGLQRFRSLPEAEVAAVEAALAACGGASSWRVRLKVPRHSLREDVIFRCSCPVMHAVTAPLAEALCRMQLQFQPQLEAPVSANFLSIPVGPELELLVRREAAKPEELEKVLQRGLDKCRREVRRLSRESAEDSYEMSKVKRRMEDLDSDLAVLSAAMRA